MHSDMAPPPVGESTGKDATSIKPRLDISARIDTFDPEAPDDNSYYKERHERLTKSIAEAEDVIANWDPEKVARQALASLKADLAHMRADLLGCEADMEAKGMMPESADDEESESDESDDSSEPEEEEVLAKGNPYSIVHRGGKFVVENNETGKVKGSHPTKEKALRQFRVLEMISHDEESNR